MMGKTHDRVGVTTAVVVGYATGLGWPATGVLTVAALAGSRLPDDLEGGILPHRWITHRIWFVAVIAAVVWLAIMGLWRLDWFEVNVLSYGRDHDIPVDWLGMLLGVLITGGITIGCGMHLVADMCTIHGLDVCGKRVHLLPKPLRIRTDGIAEHALRLLIYIAWGCGSMFLITGCGGESKAAPSGTCATSGREALTIAQQYISEAAHLGIDKLPATADTTIQVRVSIPSEKPMTVTLRCEQGKWMVREAQQAAW